MEENKFEKLMKEFELADTEGKIIIYTDTEGLTGDQYKALLKHYPLEEISKLEAALEA